MANRGHKFGGSWTEVKLDKVRQYLAAYNIALKDQPFDRIYIDAFAGTGYRTSKTDPSSNRNLFDVPEVNDLAKGSAQVALEVEPAFDRYIFIEQNRNRLAELKKLASHFPGKSDRIEFVRGNANEVIKAICLKTNWRRSRAVMFLDPYGMQVDWSTIEQIARTRSIDLWYLFASGIGVNRLLTRSGRIPPQWQAKLDRMLGYRGWREEFYASSSEPSLFGNLSSAIYKNYDDARAERFILNRLREIFAGVAEPSLALKNSTGHCMYHLVFACGSKAGAKIALRIAQHIITQ